MSHKRNRYLGVQPFKTSDRHLFFGRDTDIKYLHDMLMLEKLVVLFGKSGYGKSSLISAGLIPRLVDEKQKASFQYKPVEIRFGNYVQDQSLSLIETLKQAIDQIPHSEESKFLKHETKPESIWVQLKRRDPIFKNRFVLIFDQFEEFFSYPLEQQFEFRKQLAETLYRTIPADLLEIFDELNDEQRELISDSLDVKVLFSIRSDRMSMLDSMKDMLPAILNKRFELKPLSRHQARQAIVKPALKGFDKEESWKKEFLTQPFEYFPKALDKILGELSSDLNGGIEAFQLQIVCAEIERAVQHGQVPDRDGNGLPDIDLPDLPDFRNLYETYYQGRLDEIPEDKRLAARLVLENGLLVTDTATGESSRMSVDGRALIKQFSATGLTEELLGQLERTYLVRKEANNFRGFNYEISHDTLVGPMQKAKTGRVEAERKAIAERVAAEEKAASAKRIRRLLGIVVVAVALVVGASSLSIWAVGKSRVSEEKELEATKAQKLAEALKDTALKNAQIAIVAKAELEEKNKELQQLLEQIKTATSEKERQEKINQATEIALDRQTQLATSRRNLRTKESELDAAKNSYQTLKNDLESYKTDFPNPSPGSATERKIKTKEKNVNQALMLKNKIQTQVDSIERVIQNLNNSNE